MRPIARWALAITITLSLILAGLASFGVVTVRQSFPQLQGSVQVTPLDKTVSVLRDARGVPHIYADTPEDLFTAQGFVHAQDRFFEMDVRRHIASGRLSELFGATQVDTDIFLRTLGVSRVAEREVELLSARYRRYLEAYTAGVNSYLESRSANDLSLEYALLGLQDLSYVPQRWTVADSLSWLKMMAWATSSNLDSEIELAVLSGTIGEQRARSIQAAHDPAVFRPIVTHGAVAAGAFDPRARMGQSRVAPLPPGPAAGAASTPEATGALRSVMAGHQTVAPWVGNGQGKPGGSNSWVVSGTRTASGRPLLANDPHLEVSIPGLFTQVGLHCRTVTNECPFDVSGFSLAGIPGVIMGHNARIAWGLTTSYADTQDLVLEQLQGTRVRRGPNDWADVAVREEEIRVAGGASRRIVVRETSNGPLLSDVNPTVRDRLGRTVDGAGIETAAALRWTALSPSRSVEAIFEFNRAGDFTQFREAARLLAAPSQNLVYADTAGNIGYQLPGDIPIRKRGDGTLPTPGWDPAYGWERMTPFNELPYAYNPPEGYIVAANQPIVATYPRPLGSAYSTGWRSQQIIERLNSPKAPLTPETTADVFADARVRYAETIVPSLLEVEPDEQWAIEGQRVLAGWDRTAPPGSAGALFFNVAMKHLIRLTFDDEIPPELRTGSEDRWYAVVAALLRDPTNQWWDDKTTPVVEDRDAILKRVLVDAQRDATRLRSRNPDYWSWGKIHRLRLRHATLGRSGVGPVEALFNRGNEPVGGGPAVVQAWGFDDRTTDFEVTRGPVLKMVVDLGAPDSSRWVNLSGQSGHAFHPNYADQLPLMAANRLDPWAFTPARVEAGTVHRLELLP